MLRMFFLSSLLFVLAGCSTIQVKTSYNPKTDFSSLKTYGWLQDMDQPSENVRINNKLIKNAVRSAVQETLDAKGFVMTERDKADFLITWFGAIEQEIRKENIDHFYAPYGYGTLYRDPYWNSQPAAMSTTKFEKGTLIFDFLDPATHTLLWRGAGSDEVVEGRPEDEITENVKRAVGKILAGFPPG